MTQSLIPLAFPGVQPWGHGNSECCHSWEDGVSWSWRLEDGHCGRGSKYCVHQVNYPFPARRPRNKSHHLYFCLKEGLRISSALYHLEVEKSRIEWRTDSHQNASDVKINTKIALLKLQGKGNHSWWTLNIDLISVSWTASHPWSVVSASSPSWESVRTCNRQHLSCTQPRLVIKTWHHLCPLSVCIS